MKYMRLVLVTVALTAASCARPPKFATEPSAPALRTAAPSRSLYVGPRVTPPGNLYRFARIYETGRVEPRELDAVNGPGPWLAYEGEVNIPGPVARELIAAVAAAVNAIPGDAEATATAGDGTRPCILALESSPAAVWQGCADRALAARVLSAVPRLGPSAATSVESACQRRVCRIRLTFAAAAHRHDRFGEIVRDFAIDASGAFWCAAPAPGSRMAPNTLRVIRGQIRDADAALLFDWLLGDAARANVDRANVDRAVAPRASGGATEVTEAGVRILQSGSGWTTVSQTEASSLISRWTRIAARLPTECREPGVTAAGS